MGKEVGCLEVTVVDAVQLPVVNHIGKQSPFVVLLVGSERQQTKPCFSGHRSPVWGERHLFELEEGTKNFKLEVYHDSKWKPAFMATALVPLEVVLESGKDIRRVRVGEAGEIRLQLVYTTRDANRQGRKSASYENQANQALQNAASSLESTLPGQMKIPQPATDKSRWSRKKLQPVDPAAPSWLTGGPTANGNVDHGVRQDAGPLEASGRSEKHSTSPLKAQLLRTRMGSRLGSLWHHKEPSKGGSANSLDSTAGLPTSESGSTADQAKPPDLLQFATPASSISPHTSSGINELQGHSSSEAGATTAEPGAQSGAPGLSNSPQAANSSLQAGLQALDSGSQAASPAQTTGSAVANGTSVPAFPPFDNSNQWSFPTQTSQTQTSQGMRLAPVEAVRIDHGDGGTAWLNRWEEHNEGGPRRATDSSLLLAERPADVSTSGRGQEPRRQTLDSGFSGVSSPLEAKFPNDGNTGFWRTGREVKEWGEHHGTVPPALLTGSAFSNSGMAPRPGWDASSSHARVLSSMDEISRSVTTQPLGPSGGFGRAQGQPGNAGQPRLGGNSRPNLMDTARRDRGGTSMVDTAMREPTMWERPVMSSLMDSARSPWDFGRSGPPPSFPASNAPGNQQPQRQASSAAALPEQRPNAVPSMAPRLPFQQSGGQPEYQWPHHDMDNIASRMGSLSHGGPAPSAPWLFPPHSQAAPVSHPPGSTLPAPQTETTVLQEREPSTSTTEQTFATSTGSEELGRPITGATGAAQAAVPTSVVEPDSGPGSFKGMVSPFAEDTSPLDVESLPSDDGAPDAGPDSGRTKSAGIGRVPMREVQEQMEAGAEASIRTNRGAGGTMQSRPSLTALLSDNSQDWLIDAEDLEIAVDANGRPIKLGSGSFGTVYKGVYDQSTDVAIKTLKYETQKDMDEALYEVAILKKQLHPNVVQFLGASIGKGSLQLVTELMAGNLYTALRNKRCTWYKGGNSIAKNIASALAFLHKKKVVHLDVKSPNILLSSNNVAKLGDLGLSAMMNTDSFVNTIKGLGTLQWTSPEVLIGTHPVTCAADVFSFGTVLWEICTGEVPKRGHLRRLKDEEAPEQVSELVWRCLDSDPAKRPSMQEAFTVLKELQDLPPKQPADATLPDQATTKPSGRGHASA